MKLKDMAAKLIEVQEKHENGEYGFELIGIRFEDKQRAIGEVLPDSKYNDGRLDERDFPEYGDEGYEDLPDAGGACAWTIEQALEDIKDISERRSEDDAAEESFFARHCYIVAGNNEGFEIDHVRDEGEIVIENAEVLEQLF